MARAGTEAVAKWAIPKIYRRGSGRGTEEAVVAVVVTSLVAAEVVGSRGRTIRQW